MSLLDVVKTYFPLLHLDYHLPLYHNFMQPLMNCNLRHYCILRTPIFLNVVHDIFIWWRLSVRWNINVPYIFFRYHFIVTSCTTVWVWLWCWSRWTIHALSWQIYVIRSRSIWYTRWSSVSQLHSFSGKKITNKTVDAQSHVRARSHQATMTLFYFVIVKSFLCLPL